MHVRSVLTHANTCGGVEGDDVISACSQVGHAEAEVLIDFLGRRRQAERVDDACNLV